LTFATFRLPSGKISTLRVQFTMSPSSSVAMESADWFLSRPRVKFLIIKHGTADRWLNTTVRFLYLDVFSANHQMLVLPAAAGPLPISYHHLCYDADTATNTSASTTVNNNVTYQSDTDGCQRSG
jgi:hypothetical protein